MFDLTGKTALVTGAGSGIGAAIAETFAAAGARVFVTDRDEPSAVATTERITTQGGTATALGLDVADEAACEGCARDVLAAGGALDVLVNNAGVGHVGTLMQTTGADLDRLYSVNVRGVFYVS
jgi:NAD(P)-dependent dehydrogenase (short-subunit alcohol dehydrogenase family)